MSSCKIVINREFCKGCDLCIKFCPTDVYEHSNDLNEKGVHPPEPVRAEDCIFCYNCELYCPDFCITVEEVE